jgi:hypothetical protein
MWRSFSTSSRTSKSDKQPQRLLAADSVLYNPPGSYLPVPASQFANVGAMARDGHSVHLDQPVTVSSRAATVSD